MDDEIIGNASSPEVEWNPPPALDEKFNGPTYPSPKMLVTVAAWERKQNQVKELEARVSELEEQVQNLEQVIIDQSFKITRAEMRLEMAQLPTDEPAPGWFAEKLRNLAAELSKETHENNTLPHAG